MNEHDLTRHAALLDIEQAWAMPTSRELDDLATRRTRREAMWWGLLWGLSHPWPPVSRNLDATVAARYEARWRKNRLKIGIRAAEQAKTGRKPRRRLWRAT